MSEDDRNQTLPESTRGFSGPRALGALSLALILYILLAVAAIQTFIGGSPVRWWVAAIVLVYLAGSAALWWRGHSIWRRSQWKTKAAVSFVLLLGLLALTAWLPDGLTHGLTLLTLSSSRLLSLATAAAIVVAGVILFHPRYPRAWVKWAIGALAAYGAVAFLQAIRRGTPYPDLFHGESALAWLPTWLQGAFIGTFIIIPAALIYLVSARLRRGRSQEPGLWGYRAVLLAVGLLLAVKGLTVPWDLTGAGAEEPRATEGTAARPNASATATPLDSLAVATQTVQLVGVPFRLTYRSDRVRGLSPSHAGAIPLGGVGVTEDSRAQGLGGWTLSVLHRYDLGRRGVALGDGRWQQGEGIENLGTSAMSAGDIVIPARDVSEVYVFGNGGHHTATIDAFTGAARYSFKYDAAGLLVAIDSGDGNTTRIERSDNGSPRAILAPHGQRTTLTLTRGGYLESVANPAGEVVRFTYVSEGLLASARDPMGHVVTFTYDELGRLAMRRDPVGGVLSVERSSDDKSAKVVLRRASGLNTTYLLERGPEGAWHRRDVSQRGTQTHFALGGSGSQQISRPDGTIVVVTQGPDPRWGGQSPLVTDLSVTTPSGLRTQRSQDRKVVLAQPNNLLRVAAQTDTISIDGRKYTRAFDGKTNHITITTPSGRRGIAVVDSLRRPVRVEIPGILPISFTYGSRGRLTSLSQGSGAEARRLTATYDAQGYVSSISGGLGVSRFEYDHAGRATRRAWPDGGASFYKYDATGNLVSVRPPGKPPHLFDYSPLGLVSRYRPPVTAGGIRRFLGLQTHQDTAYSYDNAGQLIRVRHPDGTTVAREYRGGHITAAVMPEGRVLYEYDPRTGHLIRITTPAGEGLLYSYDGALLTSSECVGAVRGKVWRRYGPSFRVVSLGLTGAREVEYGYDADGLLIRAGNLRVLRAPESGLVKKTELTLADRAGRSHSLTVEYEYNGFGDIMAFGAAPLLSVQYERDAAGRIIKKVETKRRHAVTYTYAYDSAGRLADTSRDGVHSSRYVYDLNGNRAMSRQRGRTFKGLYDNQDRLVRYGDATYSHTTRGEWKTRRDSGAATEYQYDSLGNLRTAVLPDGRRIDYIIDGRGRRIGKRIDGALVQAFLYQDALRPIAELDGESNIVSRFVYATRINVPDYLEKGGRLYGVISDHLGSPRVVVEVVTGEIAQRIDYDEFGKVLLDTNPGFQPFGFAGGLYDHHTKLTRFGARDYDAITGRWTTRDPVGFAGGLNLYGYVAQDPIGRSDPSGLQPTTGAAAADIVAGTGIATTGVVYGATAGVVLGHLGEATGVEILTGLLDLTHVGAVGVGLSALGGWMIGRGIDSLYTGWSGQSMGEDFYDFRHPSEDEDSGSEDPCREDDAATTTAPCDPPNGDISCPECDPKTQVCDPSSGMCVPKPCPEGETWNEETGKCETSDPCAGILREIESLEAVIAQLWREYEDFKRTPEPDLTTQEKEWWAYWDHVDDLRNRAHRKMEERWEALARLAKCKEQNR